MLALPGHTSEQRTLSKTQNNHLTGKAPYKFESISLQRRVHCEPDFLDPDKSCFWLRGRPPSCLSARRVARAGAALEAWGPPSDGREISAVPRGLPPAPREALPISSEGALIRCRHRESQESTN